MFGITLGLSEKKIIQFIKDNYQDEQALSHFFENLHEPLPLNIFKIEVLHPMLGEITFDIYASQHAYFKKVLELSLPNLITQKQPWNEKTLKKILKRFNKEPHSSIPFFLMRSYVELVLFQIITSCTPEVYERLLPYLSKEIIRSSLIRSSCDVFLAKNTLIYLIDKLDTTTIDYLMLKNNRHASILDRIFQRFLEDSSLKNALCNLLKKTSSKKRTELITSFKKDELSIWSQAANLANEPELIDALFDNINIDLINKLILSDMKITFSFLHFFVLNNLPLNPYPSLKKDFNGRPLTQENEPKHDFQKLSLAGIYLLKYIYPSTLWAMLNMSFTRLSADQKKKYGLEDINTPEQTRSSCLDHISQRYPLMFNAILSQLWEHYSIHLSPLCLYRLTESNLMLYISQHPEVTLESFKGVIAYPLDINPSYQKDYLDRLDKALQLLKEEKAYFPPLVEVIPCDPVVNIILSYAKLSYALTSRAKKAYPQFTHLQEEAPIVETKLPTLRRAFSK